MHKLTYKKAVYETIYLNSIFSVKRFRPIIRLAKKSQEKFTVVNIPDIGFLCYLDSAEILLQGSWLENKGLII